MVRHCSTRSVSGAMLATLLMLLLGGCALLQPPPVPGLPRFGLRGYHPDASCAADIARAHAALAAAGAAAGDPAAIAAAHAAAAAATSEYHACLAQSGRP